MRKNYSEEETNYENEEETDDSGFGLSFLRIPLIPLVALFIVVGQGELEEGQFAYACIWFSIAVSLIALIIYNSVFKKKIFKQ